MAKTRSPKKAANKQALADALDVSVRSINTYLSSGMPGGKGPYDVAVCKAWVANSIRPRAGTANGAADVPASNLLELKRRLECGLLGAKLAAAKMQNEMDAGELVNVSDVRQAWNMAMGRIKQRLQTIPDETEMMLPVEVRQLVKSDLAGYVHSLLTEMASWQPTEEGAPDGK